MLTNFDIYAAAGGMNIPVTLVFTNAVTNCPIPGALYAGGGQRPHLRACKCGRIGDVFSDTDGIPDWWRLAYFGHALGQASDLSRGSR